MTRHRELLESASSRALFPIFRGRRARDRRSRRAQPRAPSAARSARPTRPRTSPPVCDDARRAKLRDPRAGRRAQSSRWPSSTAGPTRRRWATTRSSPRSASRPAPVRQRLREGRAPGGRLGRRRRRRLRALAGRTAPSPTPRVGLTAARARPHRRPGPRSCCAARQPAEDLFAEAGAARRGGLRPRRRPARHRRLQAASRRRTDPAGPAHGLSPAAAADTGRLNMQVTMTVNGETSHPRDRAPPAPRPLPARRPRPDRHPLGLRHQQLRHLRGPDGRRAGEVLHRARRDGRRARRPHGRGPRADGVLDPVQQGFMEEHGLQCGFCTPGMMMTARALLDREPGPGRRTRSGRRSPARSAGAPATRPSCGRCSGPPPTRRRRSDATSDVIDGRTRG